MSSATISLFVIFVVLVFCMVIPICIGVYVYRDAKRRRMNALLWTVVAVLAPTLIGFIIYLLVRGNYSDLRCPQCDAAVTNQYVVCPKCGAKLRPSCGNCGMPIESDWKVCPKCAQPLPLVQTDIHPPIKPKDNGIWKVIAIIILVPVVLIGILVMFMAVNIGGGSCGYVEVPETQYYEELESEEIADKVREWIATTDMVTEHAYALRYEHISDTGSQFYFLIYVPGAGQQGNADFGQSTSIFGTTLTLDLNSTGTGGSFICMTSSADKAPNLKIKLDDKRIPHEISDVDFNPTIFFYVSESDYSALIDSSGDLYVEGIEKELKADDVQITKVANGREIDVEQRTEPDFILNTVVEIHELRPLDESPDFLQCYSFSDYYWISIHYSAQYVDGTDEANFEDMMDYWVIEEGGSYFLLETLSVNQSDRAPGQIPEPENLTVYQITEECYKELEMLFD